MTFGTKIQSLTGANSGIYGPSVAWANSVVFETNGTDISRYGLISGLEELAVSQVDWPATYGSALAANGDIIGPGPGVPFNGGIQTLDPATLTRIATAPFFGVHYCSTFAGVLVGSQQYCVGTGPGGAIGGTKATVICQGVTQVYADGWPVYAQPGSDYSASLCSGKPGNNTVYLSISPNNPAAGTQKVSLIEYICGLVINKRTLVEYIPTDIDAAWTEIYFGGACIDQTDGNLLVFLAGQSGATTRNYLLKVSVTDGSTVWQVAGVGTTARTAGMMRDSNIAHQRFGYVCTDTPKTITIINTVDGSTVTTQTAGLDGVALVVPSEAYSDTLGCTVSWYNFSDMGADSPARLNSTGASFDGLGVLYIAEAFVPPVTVTQRRFLAQSRPVRHGSGAPAIVPITDDARITESGDIRITMEADIRVILP